MKRRIMEDYYEILQVHPKASQEIIKKAYQTLAKRYHPDVYPDKNIATKHMSLLNEAYAVLSNKNARTKYDMLLNQRRNNTSANASSTARKARPQPQSKTYTAPKSKIERQLFAAAKLAYINKEIPFKGKINLMKWFGCGTSLFCQENYDSISNSYITQRWITIFLFPIFPLNRYRIIKNPDNSFYIISKIPYKGNLLNKYLSMYKRNKYGTILTILVICLLTYNIYKTPAATNANKPKPKPAPTTTATPASNKSYTPKSNVQSAYVKGQPLLNNSGLGKVTLDNSRNDAPVYVRLWTSGAKPSPVRAFTVAAHSQFTLNNVDEGYYTIRYKFLYEEKDANTASKSEPFQMTETPTDDGTEYSVYTLTLYKVSNGNTKTTSISPNDV